MPYTGGRKRSVRRNDFFQSGHVSSHSRCTPSKPFSVRRNSFRCNLELILVRIRFHGFEPVSFTRRRGRRSCVTLCSRLLAQPASLFLSLLLSLSCARARATTTNHSMQMESHWLFGRGRLKIKDSVVQDVSYLDKLTSIWENVSSRPLDLHKRRGNMWILITINLCLRFSNNSNPNSKINR